MHSIAVAMTWLVTLAAILSPAVASPFATTWWSYEPAPGQFVNNAAFNDPSTALGAPDGAGAEYGNVSSVLSLGGFGGSVILGFDHLVEDDPRNPAGLDAIVFGNATWVDDPELHWAECAVIEIALDANGDRLPNDPWYLIPGSHITDLDEQFVTQAWDDDPLTETPPANLSWVPAGVSGEWETSGYQLDAAIFGSRVIENPSSIAGQEGIYGYGDFTPTLLLGDLDADDTIDDEGISAEAFYTVPDDPLLVGITEGSGGGDAFDIAWAIDPATGAPADLPGFHFIRLTSGVDAIVVFLGEKSPEIDAVADVAPDPFGDADQDGDIDLADFAYFHLCVGADVSQSDSCTLLDWDEDMAVALSDFRVWAPLMSGPEVSR